MEVATERDADLTVLHINLYQLERSVTRTDLRRTVEDSLGRLPRARYIVRQGFLVEQSILDEVAAEEADVVVVGRSQVGRFRRLLRRAFGEPDIEAFLRAHLDCEVVTVHDE